jgi:tRNA(Leu) C34 or U34 (ribose-2'-O)-methylase TrmL
VKEQPDEFVLGTTHHIRKDKKLFDESHTPAIVLYNPKYPHNVGAAVRAASCFGSKLILFTGERVSIEPSGIKGYRLPREERMRGYKDVTVINDQYPFNRFDKSVTPVAVEMRPNSEQLPFFEHPPNAVYVFGPEDGNIPQIMLKHCHRFLVIPSKHCVNLAAAIYLVLYDRVCKEMLNGQVLYEKANRYDVGAST